MQPSREFVRLLTDSQSRLYAYIFALVGDEAAVSDVLQETNLVLLEKCDEAMAASPPILRPALDHALKRVPARAVVIVP